MFFARNHPEVILVFYITFQIIMMSIIIAFRPMLSALSNLYKLFQETILLLIYFYIFYISRSFD
jgi:hypothetical protein